MEAGEILVRNRVAWARKPGLRLVYAAIYRRITAALVPGRTIEVGAGTGNFKGFARHVIATDVQFAPWLDVVADAVRLPFPDGAFDNLIMIDVLHHIPRPRAALAEAARVVRRGGRIVLAEPAITAGSGPFYRRFHREPVRFTDDPFGDAPLWLEGDPYAANQAIPTILFVREADRLARALPALSIRSRTWFDLIAYPLSGGFQRWSLLPAVLARPLIAIEERLAPLVGRLLGFRILVVLDRR